MIKKSDIQSFIVSISHYRSENVFNPWSEWDEDMDLVEDAWINRRLNLEDHLNIDAKYILVGEAPGYQGCRYSGIPFTSERLIYQGKIPRLEWMADMRITSREKPWSEPSATIVWKTLKELGIERETVLWNAFPWHPYIKWHEKTVEKQLSDGQVFTQVLEVGGELSNRKPTEEERQVGLVHLDKLINMYSDAIVIAVGNTAHQSLLELDRITEKVRHPARGGANAFKSQLKELIC